MTAVNGKECLNYFRKDQEAEQRLKCIEAVLQAEKQQCIPEIRYQMTVGTMVLITAAVVLAGYLGYLVGVAW